MHSCTIYIDDVDIQTLGVYIDDSFAMPMFNIENINSISIPGRPGELYYNDKPGPIVFKIPLYSISDDELERQNVMRRFKKLLIDNDGKSKVVKLKNSQEPDIYYNVRLSSSNEMEKDMHQVGEFELELTCYEGFGLLVQEDSLLWGDTVVPLGSFNYEMGDNKTIKSKDLYSNGSIIIDNKGYNTYPIITIKGTTSLLTIQLNGVSTTINPITNQTLVIDCKEKSVLFNGIYDLSKTNDLNWLEFTLKKGINNIWFYATNIDLNITIDYEERIY